jgi:hypothetical protein
MAVYSDGRTAARIGDMVVGKVPHPARTRRQPLPRERLAARGLADTRNRPLPAMPSRAPSWNTPPKTHSTARGV